MLQTTFPTETLEHRLSRLVLQEFRRNEPYQELLDEQEMIELIKGLFEDAKIELEDISDDDLSHRIDGVLATHCLSNLLSDFTPEQMKEFENAVMGR
jgi:hypothetical protein